MPRLPKSITVTSELFKKPTGILSKVLTETRILLDIQATVKEVIDADIQVAAIDDGQLLLTTPSAAVATRIKYRQRTILGRLREENLKFQKLKVVVRPQQEAKPEVLRKPLAPSPENQKQLRAAADHIQDADLSAALEKLANRRDN